MFPLDLEGFSGYFWMDFTDLILVGRFAMFYIYSFEKNLYLYSGVVFLRRVSLVMADLFWLYTLLIQFWFSDFSLDFLVRTQKKSKKNW